jgi:transposase InsO family protein
MLWVFRTKDGRECWMDLHQNARSVPASRALLVERVTAEGLDRARGRLVVLRQARLSGAEIASRLQLPRSTVSRWLRRLGMGRLAQLAPPEPLRRYEKSRAGELVHLDIKKLGRIQGVGHRITGQRQHRNRGIGWEFVHVAIDDASRLAYAEILADERATSAVSFLQRAVAWFSKRRVRVERVLSDNGSCYIADRFAELCRQLDIKHSRTKPYRPRTNGKAERFLQTLQREWAYAFALETSDARSLLPRYLHFYNHHRAHTALGARPPISRLSLNNAVRINT